MKCTCGSRTQPGPHTGFVELQLLSGPSAPLAHAPASGLAHARSGLPGHKRCTDFSFQARISASSKGGVFKRLTVMLNHFSCFFYLPSTKLGLCPFSLENTSSKGPRSIAMLVLPECKSLTKWHIAFVALRPASAWSAT